MPNEQGPDRGDDPTLAVYPTGPREELRSQRLLAVAREDAGGTRRLPRAGEVEDQRRDVVDLVGPTMGDGEAREQRELIDTHSLKGLDELAADTRGHVAVAARAHIAPRTEERRNHAAAVTPPRTHGSRRFSTIAWATGAASSPSAVNGRRASEMRRCRSPKRCSKRSSCRTKVPSLSATERLRRPWPGGSVSLWRTMLCMLFTSNFNQSLGINHLLQ